MRILASVVLALTLILLSLTHAVAQSGHMPPTAVVVADDFSPINAAWRPVSGKWVVGNGTYGSHLVGDPDISVITEYDALFPGVPPNPQIAYPDYTVRARVRNQGTLDTQDAGIVYGYQDPQNYYEAVISALGTVTVRTVVNGQTTVEIEAPSGIQRDTWCELEVHWKNGVTVVKINGLSLNSVSQSQFTSGQVGLVTHAAVARFDKVFIGAAVFDQEFFETFDRAPFVTFEPQSGQWSVSDGTYRSGVQQTSLSLVPIHAGEFPGQSSTFDYTFRARLTNPYRASGNLVGIVFNYNGTHYTELVFSPTGVAKLNRVVDGVVSTIATASYGGGRNIPFDVELLRGPNTMQMSVDGQRLFEDSGIFAIDFPAGGAGLITHWAPGRFDNIQFDHGFFQPCSITFDDPALGGWVVNGAWNANGGTLNGTSVEPSAIVRFDCLGNVTGDNAGTGAIYRARLLNEYAADGNRVGLIYNYQDLGSLYGGDYYEVVFSSTGIVQLNKFIQGVRYPIRTGSHNVPRNTWFNVALIRDGVFTTVKVNGATVVSREPQGELRGGKIGVITHWAKGRFDNVTLVEDLSPPATP